MTIQTAVLIETLAIWAQRSGGLVAIFSPPRITLPRWQSRINLRLERDDAGRILGLYISRFVPPGGQGPQLIVDDGGDATRLIHKGFVRNGRNGWKRRRRVKRNSIKNLLKRVNAESRILDECRQ